VSVACGWGRRHRGAWASSRASALEKENAMHRHGLLAVGVRVGAFAVAVGVVGCSGNDGAISVEPAESTLTDQGGDALFSLKLDEGRSEGYDVAALTTKVTPDGGDEVTVTCALVDGNGNGKLDEGESLRCVEPAENLLGANVVGEECDVELFANIDGDDERVGDATWTPK
jgi:hypothetical protein